MWVKSLRDEDKKLVVRLLKKRLALESEKKRKNISSREAILVAKKTRSNKVTVSSNQIETIGDNESFVVPEVIDEKIRNVAVIGAGGHCTVVIDIIKLNRYNIVGIYDDRRVESFCGYTIFGKIDEINTKIENFIIAIGDSKTRKIFFEKYPTLNWCTLIRPLSIISPNCEIGEGSVICAGSILQPYVKIGSQCIINTNSSVDHESTIGEFSSICPSVTICGQVNIGKSCFIGANSDSYLKFENIVRVYDCMMVKCIEEVIKEKKSLIIPFYISNADLYNNYCIFSTISPLGLYIQISHS